MFIAKDKLTDVLDLNRYFLIGEKGTGKIAYTIITHITRNSQNCTINIVLKAIYS